MEFQAYVVCEAADSAAIGLKEAYGESSKTVIYVKKAPQSRTQEQLHSLQECYALLQVRTSGVGYSYGTAMEAPFEPGAPGKPIDMEAGKLVLEHEDGHILGYCYDESVFLPLDGGYRKVDYDYHYQVFPTDGTSSEYSCTTYAKLESRKDTP